MNMRERPEWDALGYQDDQLVVISVVAPDRNYRILDDFIA